MPEVEIELPRFKPKQELLWNSKANEILIAGDTRAGKSFFIRRSYILWCSQIPGLVCDILRLNLTDCIRNYMDGETSFPVLLREWEKAKLVKINQEEITFWNDSKITLGHCADDKVARKHQGNTVHVRTIDEAAQLPENRLRALSGWVTMTREMNERVPDKWKGQFPKFFYLTNFVGPGMGFFRRGFLEPREPLVIEQVGQFKRQYIPMFLSDNDSEDAEQTIARIKEAFTDPATQKALLECNWRQPTGDYYPEWQESKHVLPNFTPPKHWFKFRTYDWGTAEPFAVLWWCVSDGQEFLSSTGETLWAPSGAIIAYREWNGCNVENTAKGLRMRNQDVAQGILDRTPENFPSNITITDGYPFSDRGESGPSRGDDSKKTHTIADIFAEEGVPLIQNKVRRVMGWSRLRDRLIGIEDFPLIYCTESCKYSREYMPALARDPHDTEDAQKDGEPTHICDIWRLAASAMPPTITVRPDESAKKNPLTPIGILNKMKPTVRRLS